MSLPFPFRPDDQALVVVDMQNDFLRVGAPQEVPEGRDAIPTCARLIAAYRESGRPVLFTRFLAGPQRTLMTVWSPECGEEQRSCWLGHRRLYGDRPDELAGADVVDELAPAPGETLVDKYGYGAFHSTILRDALVAQACDQVVVCGVITQICVEDTVRQGFHQGLEMVVVRDAVASFDAELHAASLRSMAMKYAAVVDADEVLGALTGDPRSSDGPGRRLRADT
jgi:nicotinamidase-related amidase